MNDLIKDLSSSTAVRIAAVGVLAILALFLFVKVALGVQDLGHADASHIHTIAVSGTGKSTTTPNVAHISFTVQENAATVAAAQTAATKRTNDALASLKKNGIADKDITTTGYNVNPQYETKPCMPGVYCTQGSTIVGYQVSQSVTAKAHIDEKSTVDVGKVLQDLGTLGVQNISGPDFGLDDDAAAQNEARGLAIKNAHDKAETLAKQLGVHLGRVVSFNETSGPNPIMMYKAQAMDAGGMSASVPPAPSLPTGQNDTNVSVMVEYEIR